MHDDGSPDQPDTAADGSIDASLPAAPLSGVVAAVLDQCSITPIGPAETAALEIPSDPRHGGQGLFGLLYAACVAGGFDLTRCAGQTAQVTSVPIDELSPNTMDPRYWASVTTRDEVVCCAVKSFEGTPGIVSANCGPAYPARAAMQRCNIGEHPTEPKQTLEEVSVPANFSDDQLWAERARVCRDGEYELTKCAGEQATLMTIQENAAIESDLDWKTAWILTRGSEVCCIWETDGAKSPALLAKKCSTLRQR